MFITFSKTIANIGGLRIGVGVGKRISSKLSISGAIGGILAACIMIPIKIMVYVFFITAWAFYALCYLSFVLIKHCVKGIITLIRDRKQFAQNTKHFAEELKKLPEKIAYAFKGNDNTIVDVVAKDVEEQKPKPVSDQIMEPMQTRAQDNLQEPFQEQIQDPNGEEPRMVPPTQFKFCPICGAKIIKGNAFCIKCGYRI